MDGGGGGRWVSGDTEGSLVQQDGADEGAYTLLGAVVPFTTAAAAALWYIRCRWS